MPLQLRGTFPVEGKANENPAEPFKDAPITGVGSTFKVAETRLGVQKLCFSPSPTAGPFGRLRKRQLGSSSQTQRFHQDHEFMIIVWSQICKQAVANLLHLSGKYGGVKATKDTTDSRESLQGNDCPLDPIKSRRRAARLSILQQLRCWTGVIF